MRKSENDENHECEGLIEDVRGLWGKNDSLVSRQVVEIGRLGTEIFGKQKSQPKGLADDIHVENGGRLHPIGVFNLKN